MKKRAQAATEYLIIIAVVIIIALIVVAVLGGIPGIGKGATGRASAAYWSSADIAITSYAVDAGGDSNVFVIKNNLRNSVTITNMQIGGTTVEPDDFTLATGASKTLDTELNSHLDCGDAGDTYSYDVSIIYTDSVTNANFTFSGDGTKLEGTCAS